MTPSTATARSMTDAELALRERALRREIPAAQSLLDAIKRERRRRKKRESRP